MWVPSDLQPIICWEESGILKKGAIFSWAVCCHRLAEQRMRGLLEVRPVVLPERDSGPSLTGEHTTQQVFNNRLWV